MSERERVARVLIDFVAGIAWENATPYARDRATKAAKWHLAALRRAKGRTVGYCARPGYSRYGYFTYTPIFKPGLKTAEGLTCRVVLVRAGAKGKKRGR